MHSAWQESCVQTVEASSLWRVIQSRAKSWNNIHVTWGKCWLFKVRVKTWSKSGEVYTYIKFRGNFISIQGHGTARNVSDWLPEGRDYTGMIGSPRGEGGQTGTAGNTRTWWRRRRQGRARRSTWRGPAENQASRTQRSSSLREDVSAGCDSPDKPSSHASSTKSTR